MIHFQEPFTIQLRAEVTEHVEHLRAGFAIMSVSRGELFNAFQIDDDLPTTCAPGVIEYNVRMAPNLLAPGVYELGLRADGSGAIDWLPIAAQFTIGSVGLDTQTWENFRGGVMRYPCRWSHEFTPNPLEAR
jgi:hypothetical protein